ncbi:STAS domain-containing protein [Tropicimonas sediminicola]|uniref:Chemotaxis protein CheX n=1 Tax=Tropicimonas sediminicola TaxID=1031541 RepID=A0A239K5X9_9RHOB|nr:STAS domain-containing protein [Tropicimonas sediminicola]SNT13525.1 chemotaxis protein CheX [Tropicimonas sediminicola]
MTAVYALPARLDLPAATPLAGELRSLRGAPLSVSADAVTHLGTPCLQVLLSAQRSWQADGHRLTLETPSPEMDEQLALFGLSTADLEALPEER